DQQEECPPVEVTTEQVEYRQAKVVGQHKGACNEQGESDPHRRACPPLARGLLNGLIRGKILCHFQLSKYKLSQSLTVTVHSLKRQDRPRTISSRPRTAMGTPTIAPITGRLTTAPAISSTAPSMMPTSRPVMSRINANNRQTTTNGHRYQGVRRLPDVTLGSLRTANSNLSSAFSD